MTLPSEVIAWAENECGGKVVDIAEQIRWRPHHFLTIERPTGTIHVVARSQRTEMAGAGFAKHFDIAHEARVLAALQDRGLKVPRFFGFNEDFGVILMEKVAGTNELSDAPDDNTRKRVMAEYIEQLAKLHQLDVESMHLSGLAIPQTPEQAAFGGKFKYIEEDFSNWRAYLRPEPFLELGIWWLHANIPRGDRRVSFVQADTGPGQFMFADGRLTALIDWELSHIGDPMLDLGVIRMRNMLYPTGSLAEPLAYYEQLSGRPIDWQALCFYTVMSMVLTPMGVSPLMQHPTAHSEHTLPGFGWDATLRRGLGEALAEAIGMDIEAPDLPDPPAAQYPLLGDYLVEYLGLKCEPVATDDAGRFHIKSAAAIARSVLLESKVGGELLGADLDDMGAVLGRRPDSRDDGLARLSEIVADDPSHQLERLIWLFARVERRREFLLEPLMVSQSSGAFERLAPQAVA
jgi:aminoglycoside phosphotransferase (APT) family kinase protein